MFDPRFALEPIRLEGALCTRLGADKLDCDLAGRNRLGPWEQLACHPLILIKCLIRHGVFGRASCRDADVGDKPVFFGL